MRQHEPTHFLPETDSEMKKILIIEDHADICRLIRMTLKLDNYDISEAPNGDTGLAMALELEPDLVLLNVMVPGVLNGLHVCSALKGRPVPPKVILLSAPGRSEDLHAGVRSGAEAHLVMPFDPLQLIECVGRELFAS